MLPKSFCMGQQAEDRQFTQELAVAAGEAR